MNADVDARLLPEPVSHSSSEDGRLANTGGTEQHREPRRHQVRRDHFAVTLAAEEKKRIELRILERRKALVRG
jgi:hypothetical protein